MRISLQQQLTLKKDFDLLETKYQHKMKKYLALNQQQQQDIDQWNNKEEQYINQMNQCNLIINTQHTLFNTIQLILDEINQYIIKKDENFSIIWMKTVIIQLTNTIDKYKEENSNLFIDLNDQMPE